MAKPSVVITRAKENTGEFSARLAKAGARTYLFPTIQISKLSLKKRDEKFLRDLKDFVYIIFTSSNSVKFFHPFVKNIKTDVKVVSVGSETRKALNKIGVEVDILPSEFSAKGIIKKLKNIKGKKILIPGSKIMAKSLAEALREKGAKVCTVYLYTTVLLKKQDKIFNSLLESGKIDYLTFMSPSSVLGFKSRLKNSRLLKQAKEVKTVSIGERTTGVLKKEGFKNIFTAKQSTAEGIIKSLRALNKK